MRKSETIQDLYYFLGRIGRVTDRSRQETLCNSILNQYRELCSAHDEGRLPFNDLRKAIIAVRMAVTRYRLGELGILPLAEIENDYNQMIALTEEIENN